ncbi:serine/threonine-protein kinase [Streptosporangium sp. NPDC051022]|uniref:serine/threonine-protein kinase n=1 Tax=Streptosporangium sp. NPDC051022 TaxID=3155752 RepID=UPI003444E01D
MSGIDTRVLAGRYRLLNPLAEGERGAVWLAADEMLRRDVAVKEIRLPPDLDPVRRREACAAALREANLAARLKHPSIVTIHDVVVEEERPWLVMELLSGASLEQTVRQRQPLPPHQAARVGVGVLSALAAAHTTGVVHQDVKPDNVFLTRTGRAVLTDFGFATVEGEATEGRTGHLVGSPNYIAPERLRGERGGPASDLWSLGATLYFAVEGLPPHPAENSIAAIGRVLTEPVRPPERAGLLGPLLMLMLAPRMEDRPSFDDIAPALQEIALGRPATVLPSRSPLGADRAAGTAGAVRADAVVPAPEAPFARLAADAAEAEARDSFPEREKTRRPGRSRRRGRSGARPRTPASPPRGRSAAVWAAAEVGAVLAVIAVTAGVVRLVSDTPVQNAPVRLSEKPGAFAVPVDTCKLLPTTDVKQLLPAMKAAGQPTNNGGCEWTSSGIGLEVAPAGTDKQWGKSPRQAHELFVNQRNGVLPNGQTAWSWPEIQAGVRSARSTAPLAVKPAGDESFGYDLYENRKTGRLEQSHVVLRIDNLVLDVAYTVVDGSKNAPAIQAGAHTAATRVAEALNKQKARG